MTVVGTHYLQVNSVPLSTHAWRITDISPLFNMEASRGSNRLVPGKDGLNPYRRRATETRYVFELRVKGKVDEDGVAYSDSHEGLVTNLDYLRTNVAAVQSSGDGTVTAIWHRPGALDDLTAEVHVTAFEVRRAISHTAWFDLEISNPSGTWTTYTP